MHFLLICSPAHWLLRWVANVAAPLRDAGHFLAPQPHYARVLGTGEQHTRFGLFLVHSVFTMEGIY